MTAGRAALMGLLLGACGDDLTIPSGVRVDVFSVLVPAGDSVYFQCGLYTPQLCARRGVEPFRVVSVAPDQVLFAGLEDQALVFTSTEVGSQLAAIDPATDTLVPLTDVPFSAPYAVIRAGNRLLLRNGTSLLGVDAGGGVEALPREAGEGRFFAEGEDAAYLWDDVPSSLWRSDGTILGTVEVGGFFRIEALSARPGGAVVVGRVGSDAAVWWTSGASNDAVHLLDLPDIASSGTILGEASGRLVLVADQRLVVTDGTAAGTRRFDEPDLRVIGASAELEGARYLVATDARTDQPVRTGLWRLDPRAGEPTLITELPNVQPDGEMIAFGDRLYFTARDDAGVEPWVSDGTADGTHRAWDLAIGPTDSSPHAFTIAGDHLMFTARVSPFYPPPPDNGYEDESCVLGYDEDCIFTAVWSMPPR